MKARTIKNPPTDVAGYDPLRTAGDCDWDGEAAARAVDFFPDVLRHPDDSPGAKAGSPIHLMGFQRDYIATLYGWKRPDGTRRYQETCFFVPRKNTKTTTWSGLTVYEQTAMSRVGAQLYSAATEREQASLVFRIAAAMVRKSPALSKMLEVIDSTRRIVCKKLGSFYRAIPSEAASAHGFKPAVVVFDELHCQTDRDLFDALCSGFGSTVNPLFAAVSTAGSNRHTVCWDVWKRARDIRDGLNDDPYFLPLIYELKEGESWHDEQVWRRCNPGIGQSVSMDFLRQEYRKAIEIPAYENVFRNWYLNEWVEQAVRAIQMDAWDKCGQGANPLDWRKDQLARLKGQPCLGGLDLGSTGDLTALALLFGQTPPFTVLPFFWVPADSAAKRVRRDGVPYDQWIKQGFVNQTGGTITDYDQVRADLNLLGDDYGIQELAVDRLFQGAQLCTQLVGDGFEVVAHGQGYMSMAAPTKYFLELVASGGLLHGNNPVLRWMASNAATDNDPAGNLKFSKKTSFERIDGVVATTMAVGRAAASASPFSVYDSRGLAEVGGESEPAKSESGSVVVAELETDQPKEPDYFNTPDWDDHDD